MYAFRYLFHPKSDDIDEYYATVLSSFMAALDKNGQMLGEWNIAHVGEIIEVSCIVPEEDSLDARHYNEITRANYEWLVDQSRQAPEYSMVGESMGLEPACRCESTSSYVLFTTFLDIEPPVICGDCGYRVPLYRLPYYGDENEHWTVLGWQSAYKACDTLYIHSGAGERFARRQMSDPKSPLTQEGLKICRDLSAKTGKPFYYYLLTSFERLVKACPACKGDWRVEEPIAGRFDLKCDACGFVSMSPMDRFG